MSYNFPNGPTSRLLYERELYYRVCSQKTANNGRLKKGVVSLRRDGSELDESIIYTLCVGKHMYKFFAENVLFFEKDEIEGQIHEMALLDCFRKSHIRHTPFTTISLVFLTHSDKIINVSLQQPNTGEPRERITVLTQKLEMEFGKVTSWFVESQDDGESRRLVITKNNFSLLDTSHNPKEYFMFKTTKFNLKRNSMARILSIVIEEPCEWSNSVRNFTVGKTISLKTENFDKICRLLTASDPEEDLSELPPPSPCTPDQPLFSSHNQLIKKNFQPINLKNVPKLPPRCLLKAKSIDDELDKICHSHEYVNTWDTDYDDDSISYMYIKYCNTGKVKVKRPNMIFRIARRARLSDHLKEDIDFEAVDYHEQYMEEKFKTRNDDPKYNKFCTKEYAYVSTDRMNIPPEVHTDEDDPYWNTDLCVFIQSMFQKKEPPNLYQKFDITQGQYAGIAVNLDVMTTVSVRRKNWTDFAQWIGITTSRNIEIIQHFCYTYKYLAMDMVFGFWWFMYNKGRNVPPCTFDQLRNILIMIERQDLLKILTRTDTNPEEGELSDEDNETYL